MTLDLTFLGTGNAFAPTRYWSSFIANGKYLFDAPPTLMPHLHKLKIDPRDIEVIFISHFHGDHYFGLPFALLEFAEKEPRTKDLTIVGPPGIKQRVEAATNLAFANVFRKRDRGYLLTFVEARNEREGNVGDITFTPYRVQHVPDLDSFSYRVTIGGQTIAYTGDTSYCEPLLKLAEGADVLVSECSCWTETCGMIHMTPNDVLKLRAAISPATKIILTHIGAGEAPQAIHDAGIMIADDLKTITL
jgi:ribonuclease BN (tRNA processing enzyme)